MTAYLNARWPNFTLRLVAGLVGGMLLIIASLVTQAWAGLPIGAAMILATAYFYAGSTWLMRQTLDYAKAAAVVWPLLRVAPHEQVIYVEVGQRNGAIALSKNLQRGHVLILDVFNPQQTPDVALTRLRRVAYAATLLPLNDPRTVWREGEIGRLPLRDNSVQAVVIDQTLSALIQHGDRVRLLREVRRVLQPSGRLVVVEPAQKPANRWLIGFGAFAWVASWRDLLHDAHFDLQADQPINSLLHAFHAVKVAPPTTQLSFDL